jgi:hypothetical protein
MDGQNDTVWLQNDKFWIQRLMSGYFPLSPFAPFHELDDGFFCQSPFSAVLILATKSRSHEGKEVGLSLIHLR